MLMKCSFLVLQENVRDHIKGISGLPPLPECIIEDGPYLNNKGGALWQMIILYKFDRSKFEVAVESISKHLESFRGLSGFNLSAHIYGPRPSHLSFREEGGQTRFSEVFLP
jgi:hypothetical protein